MVEIIITEQWTGGTSW